MLGGVDWGEVATPLFLLHPVLGVLFMGYIAFAILCVLNIVTGVFVENANKLVQQDEEAMLLKELSLRREWLEDCCKLFYCQDNDMSGEVDWEEFLTMSSKPEVQAWFGKIGIETGAESIKGLFRLLDLNG